LEKIATIEAAVAALTDRITRLEAGRDLDQQQQRSALDRIAASAAELVRLEKRR
jgi:hypothetical protein